MNTADLAGSKRRLRFAVSRMRLLAIMAGLFVIVATIVGTQGTAVAAAGSDTLFGSGNETLSSSSLFSAGGTYEARMQSDGNFVLYGPSGPLWATYTHGSASSRLVMQSDGNLVAYDGPTVLWASGTSGTNSRLVMQTDGNLVIYNSAGAAVWSTYTSNGVSKMAAAGAVAYARLQLGKPYAFGATGPNSFDCSGLTLQAYASVGVGLLRTSEQQFTEGTPVNRADLQPGDLVFYTGQGISPGHEAIYIGNGQIIEALRTGTNVMINTLDFPGGYVGARRVA